MKFCASCLNNWKFKSKIEESLNQEATWVKTIWKASKSSATKKTREAQVVEVQPILSKMMILQKMQIIIRRKTSRKPYFDKFLTHQDIIMTFSQALRNFTSWPRRKGITENRSLISCMNFSRTRWQKCLIIPWQSSSAPPPCRKPASKASSLSPNPNSANSLDTTFKNPSSLLMKKKCKDHGVLVGI
jgi:hypothetical protein